jgi:hypothetical protein
MFPYVESIFKTLKFKKISEKCEIEEFQSFCQDLGYSEIVPNVSHILQNHNISQKFKENNFTLKFISSNGCPNWYGITKNAALNQFFIFHLHEAKNQYERIFQYENEVSCECFKLILCEAKPISKVVIPHFTLEKCFNFQIGQILPDEDFFNRLEMQINQADIELLQQFHFLVFQDSFTGIYSHSIRFVCDGIPQSLTIFSIKNNDDSFLIFFLDQRIFKDLSDSSKKVLNTIILCSNISDWIFENSSQPERNFSVFHQSITKQIINWSSLRAVSFEFRSQFRQSFQQNIPFEFVQKIQQEKMLFRGDFDNENNFRGIAIHLNDEEIKYENAQKSYHLLKSEIQKYDFQQKEMNLFYESIIQEIEKIIQLFNEDQINDNANEVINLSEKTILDIKLLLNSFDKIDDEGRSVNNIISNI